MRRLVVDGRNYSFRAGVLGNLNNARGEPVEVIFGFLNMLKRSLDDWKPDQVIVAWDGGKSRWRRKLLPTYKKPKIEIDEEKAIGFKVINEQVDRLIQEVLPELPILQLLAQGFEADDLIAAVAVEYPNTCIIVSTDHDYYQLLDVADISATSGVLYTAEDFKKDWGFDPSLWIQYRAAVGDSSDCIEGVPGVGRKTAEVALRQYGSMEGWVHHCKGKRVEVFTEYLTRYYLNMRLIDFRQYPRHAELRQWVRRRIDGFQPRFEADRFRKFLFHQSFTSVLKGFPAWAAQLEKLTSG